MELEYQSCKSGPGSVDLAAHTEMAARSTPTQAVSSLLWRPCRRHSQGRLGGSSTARGDGGVDEGAAEGRGLRRRRQAHAGAAAGRVERGIYEGRSTVSKLVSFFVGSIYCTHVPKIFLLAA